MSKLWQKLIRPVMFGIDAERAHELGIKALRAGFGGLVSSRIAIEIGEVERFGLKFANPLGVAAGFDKNGVVVNQLASLGFGSVEVGTVTYRPQPGNLKPRLFRLPKDNALINRLGFNNDGAEVVAARLRNLDRECIVGVNIGRNKDVPNEEATENYLKCFEIVHDVADYLTINVSSPNTPNLRELQRSKNLRELVGALAKKNTELGAKPLLVKIAPDLAESEIEGIVDIALSLKVSGIIATNTSISRVGLIENNVVQVDEGGLSGRPLACRSTEVVSTIFRHSKGKLPIIGVGGVFTAHDAFAKLAAGASLIQAYTGFVYSGPSFASDISAGLASILREKGLRTLDEAVGFAHRD